MTESLAPKSDQLDAVDLAASGPRTFTIEKVSRHNAEQPFNFHLAEFPRVWRPGKSMRRVIAAAWGTDASKYVGRRVTLYCDPSVQFGGELTGGTRISHLSHIDKPLRVPLLIKRGKSAMFTVQPLPDAPAARDWVSEARQFTTVDDIRTHWKAAQAGGASKEQLAEIAALATQPAPAEETEP